MPHPARQADAERPVTRHRYRTGHAVFLVTVSPDFRPQRYWTWPDTFTDAELVGKNLPMVVAAGFCRTFNQRQVKHLQAGEWDCRWAIATKHLRHRYARRRRRGGAK